MTTVQTNSISDWASGVVNGATNAATNSASAIVDTATASITAPLQGVSDLASTLGRKTFWARIITGSLGLTLVMWGIIILLASSEKVRSIAKTAVIAANPEAGIIGEAVT